MMIAILISSLAWAQENSIISYDTRLELSNTGATMMIFGTQSCSYCDILKKDIDGEGGLKDALKASKIYYISLDSNIDYTIVVGEIEQATTNFSLRKQYGGKATPTIVLFDDTWHPVLTIPGYLDKKSLTSFVEYVVSGAHETKDLQMFIDENQL